MYIVCYIFGQILRTMMHLLVSVDLKSSTPFFSILKSSTPSFSLILKCHMPMVYMNTVVLVLLKLMVIKIDCCKPQALLWVRWVMVCSKVVSYLEYSLNFHTCMTPDKIITTKTMVELAGGALGEFSDCTREGNLYEEWNTGKHGAFLGCWKKAVALQWTGKKILNCYWK